MKKSGTKVILMTAAPVRWTDTLRKLYGKPPYDVNDPLGFDKAALERYNDVVRKLAKELNIPLVDVYAVFGEHASAFG